MANNLQKLIYNLSAASPLCFTFAILWYIQKQTLIVPAICVCLGSFFMLCFARSFSYVKKHVAPIMIRVTDISPKDGQMAAYVISYMLPFASMAIDDFDITVCGIIAAALIAIILFANSVTSNPLLFLRKYHFYEISAENGVSGYLLICKRDLRNAKHITTVKRVFEFLLIDSEG
mgnify:FL=1